MVEAAGVGLLRPIENKQHIDFSSHYKTHMKMGEWLHVYCTHGIRATRSSCMSEAAIYTKICTRDFVAN